MGFHTFIREKVDAAVFEPHHGGEFDVTNVIQKPVVTGITTLGMNHANEIGLTIEDVAWHKAEIFKTGSPAFSMPQVEAGALVESVLRNRAAEKGTSLSFISTATTGESLPANGGVLNVPVQRLNCSLALELVRMFLQITESGHTMTSDDITTGVKKFSWSGRYEVIQDKT